MRHNVRHVARLLLVCFLVPVLGVLTPTTAQAAQAVAPAAVPESSGWKGVTWHAQGIDLKAVEFHYADCGSQFAISRDGLGQLNIGTNGGYCKGMPDLSPWSCQVVESGCTEVRLTFEGPGCHIVSLMPPMTDHPDDSFTSVKSAWGPASQLAGACDPTQACIEVWRAGSTFMGSTGSVTCAEIELDPPGETQAPGGCSVGSITEPELGEIGLGGSPLVNWHQQGTVKITGGPETNPYDWRFYLIVEQTSGTGTWVGSRIDTAAQWAGGPGIHYVVLSSGTPAPVGTTVTLTTQAQLSDRAGSTPPVQGKVVGYGVFRNANGAQNQVIPTVPTSLGRLGATSAANCSWYWGKKISNVDLSEIDDPIGPVTDPGDGPVEPPPPPLGPEDLDQPVEDTPVPEDEPSFWGGILELLRALIRAVLGIASAIIDGLVALFTPHPDEWGWDGLQSDLEARPPYSLVAGAFGLVSGVKDGFSGAGSCGTLTDFGDGKAINCNQVKDSPGLGGLYALVQAGLIGATVLGVGIMVSRSVGGKS